MVFLQKRRKKLYSKQTVFFGADSKKKISPKGMSNKISEFSEDVQPPTDYSGQHSDTLEI